MVTSATKLKDAPCMKSYSQPRQQTEKQGHYFAIKVLFFKDLLFNLSRGGHSAISIEAETKKKIRQSTGPVL